MISLYAFLFLPQYAGSPHVVMLSFLSDPIETETIYAPIVKGIPVTYFGHSTISDSVGLATFWYEGEKQLIYLLVCNQIEPIMAYHNTVDYWKVSEGAPYSFYIIEKKHKDEYQMYMWDVQKIDMKNSRIPMNTIIIHVHPDEIRVGTGITPTSNNMQVLIPEVYVKKNNFENTFRFAAISQFFARMNQTYNLRAEDVKTAS